MPTFSKDKLEDICYRIFKAAGGTDDHSKTTGDHLVAANLADKCTIQISYAIGIAQPVSVYINTHQTGKIVDQDIRKKISEIMDLSPYGIREKLFLNKPIYQKTASYGHFGRKPEDDGGFSWERLDLVEPLKKILG